MRQGPNITISNNQIMGYNNWGIFVINVNLNLDNNRFIPSQNADKTPEGHGRIWVEPSLHVVVKNEAGDTVDNIQIKLKNNRDKTVDTTTEYYGSYGKNVEGHKILEDGSRVDYMPYTISVRRDGVDHKSKISFDNDIFFVATLKPPDDTNLKIFVCAICLFVAVAVNVVLLRRKNKDMM